MTEKFTCPYCHIESQVEIVQDSEFIFAKNQYKADYEAWMSKPSFARKDKDLKFMPKGGKSKLYIAQIQQILNDPHTLVIKCPICGYRIPINEQLLEGKTHEL